MKIWVWIFLGLTACAFLSLVIVPIVLGQEVGPPSAEAPRLNRVSAYCGYGQDGLTFKSAPSGVSVSPLMAPLVGLSYQRLVTDRVSLGALGLFGVSTQSRTLSGGVSVGYDF